MVSLDGILTWVVPAIIFIYIGAVIYGNQKEAIDKFFATIKAGFIKKKEEIHNTDEEYESILTYR